jgi:hypothetical protein
MFVRSLFQILVMGLAYHSMQANIRKNVPKCLTEIWYICAWSTCFMFVRSLVQILVMRLAYHSPQSMQVNIRKVSQTKPQSLSMNLSESKLYSCSLKMFGRQ